METCIAVTLQHSYCLSLLVLVVATFDVVAFVRCWDYYTEYPRSLPPLRQRPPRHLFFDYTIIANLLHS